MEIETYRSMCGGLLNLIVSQNWAAADLVLDNYLIPKAGDVAAELHPAGDVVRREMFAGYAQTVKDQLDGQLEDTAFVQTQVIIKHIGEAAIS